MTRSRQHPEPREDVLMTHNNAISVSLFAGFAGTLFLAAMLGDEVASALFGGSTAADDRAGAAVVLIAGGTLLTMLLLSLASYPFVRASIGRAGGQALGTE